MQLTAYTKSIVAFIAGLVTPLAAAAAAHGGVLTTTDLLTAVATAVVSGGTVLASPKNTTSTVAGLVVKVVADLAKFKAALDVALSQSLVIEPQPVTSGPPQPAVVIPDPPVVPPTT